MRKLTEYGPSLVVLATALLVLFVGPGAVRALTFEQTKARLVKIDDRLDTSILEQMNQAMRDVAQFVEPSVVHISAETVVRDLRGDRRTALSSGSGWVFDESGHIVTNHHVIEGAERIDVQLYDGEIREGEIVGFDQFTDIAVVKIAPGRLHPAVRSSLEQEVRQGDLVFAFGSPFNFRFSMSKGVVSGKGRSVGVIRDQYGVPIGYENFIQVDAAINPGNSGGPLTDYRGRVIGMNTAIATGRGGQGSLEEGQFAGIGLAIPLEMINPVVTQLIEKGVVEKGYVGVNLGELTPDAATELRGLGLVGTGVLITDVVDDSPADRAGLELDDVITRVNGEDVMSVAQLRSIVSSMLPGEVANLTVWRVDRGNGEARTLALPVTLSRLPTLRVTGLLPPDQDPTAIVELGIEKMRTSSVGAARRAGVEHRAGVLIEAVVPGSTLDEQLVLPGAILIEVTGAPVRSVEEFIEVLGDYNLRRGARAVVVNPDGTAMPIVLHVPR